MGGSESTPATPEAKVEVLDEGLRERWRARKHDVMEKMFAKCKNEQQLPVMLSMTEVLEKGDEPYARDFMEYLKSTNTEEHRDMDDRNNTYDYYADRVEIGRGVLTSTPIMIIPYTCQRPRAFENIRPSTKEFVVLRFKSHFRGTAGDMSGSHGIPYLAQTNEDDFRIRPKDPQQ
eukprot:TRINITY_DN46790_c0_g1_i1.p1 TRINITY_DN46790_c0_g1~~TRINITY_DN46790_c0_g1_i1.p1  ORF type:complete len:185 (+),score=44.36 TRINITY_DN46790_c0_g1_i1:33-557(+)